MYCIVKVSRSDLSRFTEEQCWCCTEVSAKWIRGSRLNSAPQKWLSGAALHGTCGASLPPSRCGGRCGLTNLQLACSIFMVPFLCQAKVCHTAPMINAISTITGWMEAHHDKRMSFEHAAMGRVDMVLRCRWIPEKSLRINVFHLHVLPKGKGVRWLRCVVMSFDSRQQSA